MIIDLQKEAQFSDERYTSQLLQETDEMRVVLFGLRAGQEVPPHTSECQVHMYCVSGQGSISVGDQETEARAGTLAFCPPHEMHGFTAQEDMSVLVLITPSPAAL